MRAARIRRYVLLIVVGAPIGFAIGFAGVWVSQASARALGLGWWFTLVPPLAFVALLKAWEFAALLKVWKRRRAQLR